MESVNRKILSFSLLTILIISSFTLIIVSADDPIINVEPNHGPEDSNIMLSVDSEMDEAELTLYWDDILILNGFKPIQINNKSLNGFNINFNPPKGAPYNEIGPHTLYIELEYKEVNDTSSEVVLFEVTLPFLIEEKTPEIDPEMEELQAKFDQLQTDYDELIADEDAPPSKFNELFEKYNELLEATENTSFEIDSEYKELLNDVNELTDNYLNVLEAVDSFGNEIRTSSLAKKIPGYPIEAIITAITTLILVYSKTQKQ